MNHATPLTSLRLTISRLAVIGVIAVFLVGIGWTAWPLRRATVGPRPKTLAHSIHTRDVYASSPFKNVGAEVAYVGDAACARCHREIAEAYHRHPMGRSLAAIADTTGSAPTNVTTGLPIEDKGVEYTIVHREGRVFHKSTQRDSDGTLLAEIEAEVRYALGSGTRGTSFLIDRDGFLFLSPIAWFAQQERWDISPGYGAFATRPNFERAIQPDCLFCHANQFRPVTDTLNRYEKPIFQGHAIGCERCHGPGELHVKRTGQSTEPDFTIVNPATLAPPLRDSVCQQCHLQGSFRFARAGRAPLDYRPGLPLHKFLAVFLIKTGNQGRFEAVGHDEQMEISHCFIGSKVSLAAFPATTRIARLINAGDWRKAVAACREAIRLNPELFEARSLLVQCYLRSHEPDKAEADFQCLIGFYPASREVWQQWYEQQKHSSSGGAGSPSVGEP